MAIESRTIENHDEIVLYHGSLEELNGRSPNHKYNFADTLNYRSGYHDESSNAIEGIKQDLRKDGYAGLVNLRTLSLIEPGPNGNIVSFAAEGTPIKKTILL